MKYFFPKSLDQKRGCESYMAKYGKCSDTKDDNRCEYVLVRENNPFYYFSHNFMKYICCFQEI